MSEPIAIIAKSKLLALKKFIPDGWAGHEQRALWEAIVDLTEPIKGFDTAPEVPRKASGVEEFREGMTVAWFENDTWYVNTIESEYVDGQIIEGRDWDWTGTEIIIAEGPPAQKLPQAVGSVVRVDWAGPRGSAKTPPFLAFRVSASDDWKWRTDFDGSARDVDLELVEIIHDAGATDESE